MNNFWTGFEKQAALGAAVGGLLNRVTQSGVGRAVAGGIHRAGNTMVGGLPLRSRAQDAMNTLGRVTGVQHLRQGIRQTGKLTQAGHIVDGKLVNQNMQGAAAAAHQNLLTGAKRLGGTALATGGTIYAGKKLFGGQPQQQPQPQQPPASVPAYQ